MEKIKVVLMRIITVTYALSFITVIVMVFLVIFSRYNVRGVESNVVYTIQLILKNNHNLYQNPSSLPFSITQYSPIYYVFCDNVLSLFKTDSTDSFRIRIYLRIITNLILLSSAILLFFFFRKKIFLSIFESLTLVILLVIFTFPWYSISRPDVLVAFCLIAVIWLMASYLDKKKSVLPFYIGIFLFLGIASKLNGVLFVVICGLYFFINNDWRALIGAVGGFFIGSITTVTILILMGYDLSFLKENIIDGIDNGYSLKVAWAFSLKIFFTYYSLLLIGVIVLIAGKWKSIKQGDHYTLYNFLLFATVLSFVYSLVTSLKIGSSINYFNEFLVLLLALVGYTIKRFYYRNHHNLYMGLMIFGIFIAGLHTSQYLVKLAPFYKSSHHRLMNGTEEEKKHVIDFLKKNLNSKYFYSSSRELNLSMPHQCVLFSGDIHSLTFKRKVYDYSLIHTCFETGEIKYLVSRRPITTLYEININEHFKLIKTIDGFNIYENSRMN